MVAFVTLECDMAVFPCRGGGRPGLVLGVTMTDDTFLPNSPHPLVLSKQCHGLESEHSPHESRRDVSDPDHDGEGIRE